MPTCNFCEDCRGEYWRKRLVENEKKYYAWQFLRKNIFTDDEDLRHGITSADTVKQSNKIGNWAPES